VPLWLIIVLVVLIVLAVGGAIARRAQLARTRPVFDATLEKVNRDLAAAAAQDRGWDRDTLEAAARSFFAAERGAAPADLALVEVIDRPGTDQDRAVFRAGDEHLTLGRHDGEWVGEGIAPAPR
jgi:hypothetical protein